MAQTDSGRWPLAAFDIPIEHINHRDAIVAVINSHLRLEGLLAALLEKELPFPKALDFERTTFAQLARIAAAVGIVPADALPVLLKVNSLRNRLAHQRDAIVTEADLGDFLATLKPLGLTNPGPVPEVPPHSNVALFVRTFMAWLNAHYEARGLLRDQPDLRHPPDRLEAELARTTNERYPLPEDGS